MQSEAPGQSGLRMDSKREKYKAAFKVSKAKVKLWENQFMKENNRKPSKADHKLAPENIQVCLCFSNF